MQSTNDLTTSILARFSTYARTRAGVVVSVPEVQAENLEAALKLAEETLRVIEEKNFNLALQPSTVATEVGHRLSIPEPIIKLVSEFFSNHQLSQANLLLLKYVLALKADNCSVSTIKNYRSDISQFFAFTTETALHRMLAKPKLQAFLREQKAKGLASSSIRRKLASITQFGIWLELERLVPTHSLKWLIELNQQFGTVSHNDDSSPLDKKQNNTHTNESFSTNDSPLKHNWRSFVSVKNSEPVSSLDINSSKTLKNISPLKSQEKRFQLKQGIYALRSKLHARSQQYILPYLNLLLSAILFLGMGYFGYLQVFGEVEQPLAFPTALTRPNRTLSFQGRLTDTNQNPIITASDMRFRLYDSGPSTAGGNLLWDSGTCSVTPDQDGIFATGLGEDCGAEIGSEVFSENANVWLQVEVEGEVLDPRQSIKSVAYALNSETLQGFPPADTTTGATNNTVLVMNNNGEVILGQNNPKLDATSGTFTIEAQTLTLQTGAGSNGNINLDPDGSGKINLLADVDVDGYIKAPGATLSATYAGGTALTLNAGPSATADIMRWQNSAGSTLGVINQNGNIGIGTTDATTELLILSASDPTFAIADSTNGVTLFGIAQDSSSSFGNATNHDLHLATNSLPRLSILAGGNVGIGSTSPTRLLDVGGTGRFTGALDLDADVELNSTLTDVNNQVGTVGQVLSSTGSGVDWIDLPVGVNYWKINLGAISPVNDTLDILVGSSATASAKFAVLNVNSGTPTASVSSGVSGDGMYMTADGTLATSRRRSLTIGNSSTYNTSGNVLINPNGTGNVGIGTTSTASRLEVASTGTNTDVQRWIASDGSRLGRFTETSGGHGWFEVDNASGTAVVLFRGDGGASYISTGNFGIGSTSPGNTLDVTGTGRFSSTLTASNGFTQTTGALNLTATSGAISLSGMSASSLDFGANNVTFTSGNFNTTSTGINSTAIGATTPSTGAFTTLSSTGVTTLGNNSSTVAIDSSSWDISSAGVASGLTGLTSSGTITFSDLTANRALFTTTGGQLTTSGVSADLIASLSDETGSGLAVFNNSPTISNEITTGSPIFNLINTNATTVNFAGAATTLNIGPGGATATSVNLAGGSAATGCTVDGATGGLLCAGPIISTTGPVGYWQYQNSAISPSSPYTNNTDLLIGSNATASAKFAVLNMFPGSGTPTASVSSGLDGNGMFMTADGTLATTRRQTLSIGNSSTYNTTGNVLINSNGTGNVGIGTSTPLQSLHVVSSTRPVAILEGAGSSTSFTSDAGQLQIVNSNTTNNNWARIGFSDVVNGTTAAGIGVQFTNHANDYGELTFWTRDAGGFNERARIQADGNFGINDATPTYMLDVNGTGRFTGAVDLDSDLELNSTLTDVNGNVGTLGQVLSSTGSGVDWIDLPSGAENYWRINMGALSPYNDTLDLLVGSNATASAKFAVLNVNNGTPAASVSSGLSGNATFMTADGTLATRRRQSLTIGNSSTYNTTGNVLINSNGVGNVGIGTTAPAEAVDIYGNGSNIVAQILSGDNSNRAALVLGRATEDAAFGVAGISSHYSDQATTGDAIIRNTTEDIILAAKSASGAIRFTTGASDTQKMVLTNAGNLGIGSTSPGNTLDVTGTGRFSSTLTASNGFTQTTGALNLTATSGTITLSGMSASSLNFGANDVTFTSANFNTTATGINSTAIGATTPSTGAFTNLSSTGTTSLGNNTATVAINSSDWDISTSGVMTGISGITNDSTFTTSGGAVNINASSNFPTNINTGTSTGSLSLGGGAGTVAVNSTSWDIDTAGVASGFTGLTSSGNITFSGLTANRAVFTTTGGQLTVSGASSSLAASLSDETGTGLAVFGTSPTLSTSLITDSTSFDLLNTTATTINFGGAATTLNIGPGSSTATMVNIAGGSGNTGCTVDGATGNLTCTGAITGTSVGLWQYINGGISPVAPYTNNADFFVGADATASAKFAVLNVFNGTPVASVSSGVNGAGMYMTADGTLATTRRRTLTIGNSSSYDTTGNVLINSNGTGNVGIGTTSTAARLSVVGITNNANVAEFVGDRSGSNINMYFRHNSAANVDNSARLTFQLNTSSQMRTAFEFISGFADITDGSRTSITHFAGSDNGSYGNRMTLYGTNLGIGTESPTARLDINGTASTSATLSFRGTTDPMINILNGEHFSIATSPGGNAGLTEKLTVRSNGNVGIGTTNPSSFKLQVAGSIGPQADDTYDLGSNTLRWKDLYLGGETIHLGASTTDEGTISYTSGNVLSFDTDATTNGDIAFFTDDLFLDKSTGNVGIGTTTPQASLEIFGQTHGEIFITTGDTGAQISLNAPSLSATGGLGTMTSHDLPFFTDNVDRMIITAAGNVGIGTTTPDNFMLEVNGDVGPHADNTYDLGAGSQQWANIYGTNIYQNNNQVCDFSGNCAAIGNLWQYINGAIAPATPYTNNSDLLIGSTATESAKFAVLNIFPGSGTPAASVSSGLSGTSMFMTADGTLATQNRMNLTIGNSSTYDTTGNVLINPNGTGNVGIGTTDPGSKFYVSGGNVGIDNNQYYQAKDSAGTIRTLIGYTSSDVLQLYNNTGGDGGTFELRNGSGGAANMTVLANGNVGISTTDASGGKLTINKDTPSNGSALETDYAIRIVESTADVGLLLGVSAADNASIIQSLDPGTAWTTRPLSLMPKGGNVGIGTISPDSALQVNGTIAPETTDQDLGSSALRWDLFANTINADSTVTLTGVSAGTDNTVLLLNASNQVIQDEVDSRIFGTTLTDGSGTANYVARWSDADTLTTGVLYDNGTNVGVGNTSPEATLHVGGGSILLDNNNFYQAKDSGGTVRTLIGYNSSDVLQLYNNTGGNGGTFELRNGNAGAVNMTVLANGNVGIGSTNPTTGLVVANARLQVTGSASPTSGTGVELGHDGTDGIMISYDRTNTAYKDMRYNALAHEFELSGTEVAEFNSDGLTITNLYGINSSSDSLRFHTNKTNDTSYEWTGFYSGATRQGIILYDGAWSGCNNVATEFCIAAENGNDFTLDGGADLLMTMAGNVGIGTTTASPAKLSVQGSSEIARFYGGTAPYITVGSGLTSTTGGYIQWDDTNNRMNLGPHGITAMSIASNGNVGVGVSNPLEKLHIAGNVRGNASGGALRIDTGNGYIDIGPQNTSWAHLSTDRANFYFSTDIAVNGGIGSYNQHLSLHTGSSGTLTTRMTILNSNGNVGIGITAPTAPLHLHSSSAATDRRLSFTDGTTGSTSGDGVAVGKGGSNNGFFWNHEAAGYLHFGAGNAERMRIAANGNVSIGTTSTSGNKFQVEAATGDGVMIGNWTEWGGTSHAGIKDDHGHLMLFTNPHLPNGYYMRFGGTSESSSYDIGISGNVFNIGRDVFGASNTNVAFGGAITCIQDVCPPNSAIRLTPNLHLNSGDNSAVILNWDNGTTGTAQTLRVGNGASSDIFWVRANGEVYAAGNVGIGSTAPEHKVRVNAGANLWGVVATTSTTVSTTANAAIYGANTSFGGYGVHGVTSLGYGVLGSSNNSGTALRGHNTGSGYALYCATSNTNRCGGDQAWFNASDRKLKKDIQPITDALHKVLNLKGVTYVMKADASNTRVMGFIAQDTLPYAPEVVSYDEIHDQYGMTTGQLTALVVEAIKEQQLQINQLGGGTQTLSFTTEGELAITGNSGNYTVTASGNTLTTIVGASKAVIGKITAGLISTKELVVSNSAQIASLSVNSLQVSGQNISDYVRNIVQQELQTTSLPSDSLAENFTTNNLTVTNNATISGELDAQTIEATTVIADSVSSSTSALGSLLANTATISGDLTVEQDASIAGTLIASSIDAQSSRFQTLESRMAELESIKAQTAELVDATVSGTLYADSIYNFDEKVADAFKKPTLLDLLTNSTPEEPTAASPASIYEPVEMAGYASVNPDIVATDSAILALDETDVVLGASALFVEKYLEVNGHAYVAQSLGIGNTLKIGNSLVITNGTIDYHPAGIENPVLAIQSSGHGKLDFLAGAMTIENGQVAITGDLTVAGRTKTNTLLTNLIQPADFGNPFQVQVAGASTESGEIKKTRFEIINETGEAVATFDADGNASFAGGISVANQDLAEEEVEDNSVTTDKSSGQAKLSSGEEDLKIKTPKATPDSLIYVTPKGSTDNKVLYIKGQGDGEFTVGFDEAIDNDVEFNWWIVN